MLRPRSMVVSAGFDAEFTMQDFLGHFGVIMGSS